jgi:hypothetical protein
MITVKLKEEQAILLADTLNDLIFNNGEVRNEILKENLLISDEENDYVQIYMRLVEAM